MSQILAQRLKPSHLRLIRAIHDLGKLKSAAEQVGLSQPAASRMLSEIEAEAGGPLFERLPRGMAPTPVGAAFARRARAILSEVDALATEVAHLRGGQAGAVRVGAVTGPAVGALVPALAAMRQVAPDFQPTVEVAPSTVLIRGLEEGRFDFVLSRIGGGETRAFQAYPGRTETICLLARADHPLAGRRVSLAETLAFDFVIQEPGSPIRTALEEAFLREGFATPERVTNSSSLLIALSILTGAEAIAPQTREVAQLLTRTSPGLAILDVQERIVVPPFLVLHDRHRCLSPVAQALLDAVLRQL
ncbi:LysR family transcriptional regulator [Jannaschia sp.]|nr:LysR family transcriptional regulator [Jannaschia sp.]